MTNRTGLARRALRIGLFLLGGLVGLVVLLALAGLSFEAIAAQGDAKRYPMPGKLVDAGGHKLHLTCAGSGSPIVILDAGLGGTSLDWTLVQPAIARVTQVCAYDRAGTGWSEPGPTPRSAKAIADDLQRLLRNAHLAPPYVVVGHSLGGKNIRLFADEHPDEVAGMVLVDARNEYMDFHTSREQAAREEQMILGQARQYRIAALFGLPRLLGARLSDAPLPAEQRTEMAVLATRSKSLDAVRSEADARAANDVELRDAPGLGDKPLIVLASGVNMAESHDWNVSQHLQAKLSRQARLVVVKGSRHYIQWDRPAVVIDAVTEVVRRVRKSP